MCFHTLLQMLKNGFGKCTGSRIKVTFIGVVALGMICWILTVSRLSFYSIKLGFTSQTLGLSSFSSVSLLNLSRFRLGLSNQTSGLRGYPSASSARFSGLRLELTNQPPNLRSSSSASVNMSGFTASLGNQTDDLNSSFHTPQQKMLIYMCVKEQGCAGWSDRQRSLAGMFLLSLVTNRRFGILLTTPCDVRNFYVPNAYDWSVDKKDLEGRIQRLIYPADNLSKIDFNQKYPEDVLFARLNSECFRKIQSNPHFKSLLPRWAKKTYGKYFRTAWKILMKPSPRFQKRLDQFLHSVNFYNRSKPLVGVHVRVGRNPSNPRENFVFNNISKLEVLWKKVEYYVKNGSQLFVTSDCEQVREMSRQRFGSVHHDTGGVILHVGKQRHDVQACQGFGDAIFDQLVLSYCDILFRSRGGFALRASLMNGKVRKIHYLANGKVSP